MKQMFLACCIAMLSCGQNESDKVKSFIPGSYCKVVNNEFNTGNDTLIITELNENIFRITRISSFNKIRNKKKGETDRKIEIWTALYNKDERVLHETKKGKVLSFLPDKKIVMVGSSEYEKIKN
jgi:precorrin-2 methylase